MRLLSEDVGSFSFIGFEFFTGRLERWEISARPARVENPSRVRVKGRHLRSHHKTRFCSLRFESDRIFHCSFDRVVFSAYLVFAENLRSIDRGARGKSKR